MLQGGPLPCFMQEEQMQRLVSETAMELSDAEKQFQLGLAKVGLLEVNVFQFLYRKILRLEMYTNVTVLHHISVI